MQMDVKRGNADFILNLPGSRMWKAAGGKIRERGLGFATLAPADEPVKAVIERIDRRGPKRNRPLGTRQRPGNF
jgi:hypothetical protein